MSFGLYCGWPSVDPLSSVLEPGDELLGSPVASLPAVDGLPSSLWPVPGPEPGAELPLSPGLEAEPGPALPVPWSELEPGAELPLSPGLEAEPGPALPVPWSELEPGAEPPLSPGLEA